MSKCSFSIPFSGNAAALISRAKSAVEGQGGSFSGDETVGSFSLKVFGTITGNYSVQGSALQIEITDKPMMLSCGMIESALKSQLG